MGRWPPTRRPPALARPGHLAVAVVPQALREVQAGGVPGRRGVESHIHAGAGPGAGGRDWGSPGPVPASSKPLDPPSGAPSRGCPGAARGTWAGGAPRPGARGAREPRPPHTKARPREPRESGRRPGGRAPPGHQGSAAHRPGARGAGRGAGARGGAASSGARGEAGTTTAAAAAAGPAPPPPPRAD